MKISNKYHLLFVIILLGITFCLIKIIFSGHIMNGDFALYICQAQSIVNCDPQKVLGDMQTMIELSTYQRYSPVLYPWGYPLLLSPLVYFFGINYTVFKIFGSVCLLIAMTLLYLYFYKKGNHKEAFITVFLTGLNLLYLHFGNLVISELPYLAFVILTLYCINIFSKQNFEKISILYYLITGFLLFMCFQIRTEGIFLAASLFISQVHIVVKNKRKSHQAILKYLLYGTIPYLFAVLLFCSFSAFFPAGFLEHTTHLEVINSGNILKNLTNYFTIPGDVLSIYSPYFYILFWILTMIGIYQSFRCYIAEITYVFLTIAMLIFWPYSEIRYWLSIIPFIVFFFIRGIFFLADTTHKNWIKSLSYLIIFILMIPVGVETTIQLNKDITPYSDINPNVEGETSTEMFRFINTYTSAEDVIACAESRVMYLYTGRLSCNLSDELSETIKKANWYVLFKHRGNYLQYDPAAMDAYKRYFKKTYSNSDFIIYKIEKP